MLQPNSVDPKDAAFMGTGAGSPVALSVQVPGRAQAVEFAWSRAVSRARGVHGFNSMDPRSRSFNLMRAKLTSLWRERSWRMLGIVSATPEVGKSFVSSNIAAALSRDPRFQAYLVDLDLRRGAVKDIFGIEVDKGIAGLLQDTSAVAALPAFRPAGEDLIIIPSVPGDVPSAELLASSRARAMLRSMRSSDPKNFFIFDLPPVFANDDAATAMESLDGYVLIVEDGKTTQQEIESAIEMLGHEQLAGVVLNKYRGGLVSEGRGIEERYASRYYGEEADSPPE